MKKKMYLLAAIVMSFALFSPAQAQRLNLEWVTPFPGGDSSGLIMTSGIALDKDENVYAVGGFRDSIKVNTVSGPMKFISYNGMGMFLAKLNPIGDVLWVRAITGANTLSIGGGGDNGMLYYFSITSDAHENLYITGNYAGMVDFDPNAGTAWRTTDSVIKQSPGMCITCPSTIDTVFNRNGFILKLDKDGSFKWVKTIPGNNNATTGIAYDAKEGAIVVTGFLKDTADFDGTVISTPKVVGTVNGASHSFVAKYDTSGTFEWVRHMGGNKSSTIDEGIATYVDSAGYIYTTGVFYDSSDYDPGSGVAYLESLSKPAGNVFIQKLDPKGNYVWAKAIGSANKGAGARSFGIAVDNQGNVITVGYFQKAAMLDPANNPAHGFPATNFLSGFISKLDANGNYVWGRVFDRPPNARSGIDYGLGVQVDAQGSIFIGGRFFGDVYLNPNPSVPNREIFSSGGPANDAFILKLLSNGDFAWAKTFERTAPPASNSNGYNLNKCIKLAPSGNLYVGGYFLGTVDFNPSGAPYSLTSIGTFREGDGFIAKLSCNDSSSAEVTVEKCGSSYDFMGETYHESGNHVITIPNHFGCDSTIYLHLVLNAVPHAVVNVNGFVLGTTGSYNTYQWMLNEQIIPGATADTYTVKQNGSYRVIVSTAEGCIDTSDAYLVTNYTDGIEGAASWAGEIKIYPNPATDVVYIQSPVKVNVTLSTVVGRTIRYTADAHQVSLEGLSSGIYLLRITDEDGHLIKVEKVVKK